jgi:hypothetical protein
MNDYLAQADSTSFSSDVGALKSPSRKYIRTADIRCRVKDVFKVTTELEGLVTSVGGIVEHSEIENEVGDMKSVYYKADSVRQVQTYTTTASITLRVPVASMDSVVKTIPELSAFLDKRKLSQSDVTLSYLSNALKNQNAEDGVKPGELARKTQEAIAAREYEEQQKEVQINRRMENLSMLDQANYATITVVLYQPQRVNEVVVLDAEHIAQAPFHLRVFESLNTGVQMIADIFFFMLQFWALWLMMIAAWIIYRRMLKSKIKLEGVSGEGTYH